MADQELEQQEPLLGRKDQINIQRGDQYTTQNSQEQKQAKSLTGSLIFAIASCAIGSPFVFGYNTGVVNAPQELIEYFINETHWNRTNSSISDSKLTLIWSITVSIFAIGGMIGGSVAGYLGTKFGRKGTMLLTNILTLAGGALMFGSKYAKSYELLIVGRFLIGINSGINTGVAPAYLSEIAPLNLKGASGTIHQFAITLGILVSQILGIEQLLGTTDGWPWLLGITIFPGIIQLVALPICPESPQHTFLVKNKEDKTRIDLQRLRGTLNVDDEIHELRNMAHAAKNEPKVTLKDMFKTPSLREPLIIALVLQLSQQFSGINAVIYYSVSVFEKAGLSEDNALYATIGSGAINTFMTFVSAVLMDRAGRRVLHLYGLGAMWVFTMLLSVAFLWDDVWHWAAYLSMAAVYLFIVSFAIGPGSIPWFIVAEMFSQGPRAIAISLAVLVNWLANFLVGVLFPSMEAGLGDYVFIPFSVLLAIFWVFTYLKVPETKGKTVEEVSALFKKDRHESPYQAI